MDKIKFTVMHARMEPIYCLQVPSSGFQYSIGPTDMLSVLQVNSFDEHCFQTPYNCNADIVTKDKLIISQQIDPNTATKNPTYQIWNCSNITKFSGEAREQHMPYIFLLKNNNLRSTIKTHFRTA